MWDSLININSLTVHKNIDSYMMVTPQIRTRTLAAFLLSDKSSSSSSCSVRRWRLLKHTTRARNKSNQITMTTHVWQTALGIIANLMHLNVWACMCMYVCLTHSPTDSRFCFSSCLIRGLPTLTFRGEVGDFWLAGWMKWANSSVCFSRNSNLFARSVFYSQGRDEDFWVTYDLKISTSNLIKTSVGHTY